jgi:poly-beta-1,6-N-acetyl-D-glucosamine synthase
VILDGQTHTETSVGLYWKYEKWIRKQLSAVDSILGATGSIYTMRRELAVLLPPGSLLDDMYQPLEAFFRGYRVVMIDSAKAYDYPTNIDAEFRRKVRTLAGNYQLMRHRPELFSPSANRMLLDYLSHKVARLLLPFALIAAFVSALFLPAPWRELALAPQLLIYGLAAVDRWLPDGFALKRLSAPARTFVVLMAASACALSILFLPSTALWRETRVRQAKAA